MNDYSKRCYWLSLEGIYENLCQRLKQKDNFMLTTNIKYLNYLGWIRFQFDDDMRYRDDYVADKIFAFLISNMFNFYHL